MARITNEDPELRMPPVGSGKSLTNDEVSILGKWISEGALYQKHWAFIAPTRPQLPELEGAAPVSNPIDKFILARLAAENLSLSPPANARTLLRRLWLDLVGLPPSPADISRFDASVAEIGIESAFMREVDRLLASPSYGERWARTWLDVARYADSDGFEKDKPRSVWMYRDWVIDALNRDMPYDEFIVEQIAGDLLPEPTQDQLVATGFLRNSMVNEEAGVDPEQFRMEAMFDRMDAIGKAVLGLTIQCAQCHTHKYDPLTHTDYYRLFAFLNNCEEPQIAVYTTEEQDSWLTTQSLIRQIETQLRNKNPDWKERLSNWETSVRGNQPEWTVLNPRDDRASDQKHTILENDAILAVGFAPITHAPTFSAVVTSPKITAIRLELLNHPSLPRGGPGRSIYGTCALTEFRVHASPLNNPSQLTEVKVVRASADVEPPERELEKTFHNGTSQHRVTGPVEFAIDGDENTAWGIDIGPGRSNVSRKAVFVLDKPLEAADGLRLTFTLAQRHGGLNANDNQNNNLGCFRFAVTDAKSATADPLPDVLRKLLDIPAEERTEEQNEQLFSYWRTTVPDWEDENQRIDALWESHPLGTTQLTLQQRDVPRKTYRLDRGNHLAPAEEVTPGVPSFLHPLQKRGKSIATPTRLHFAKWLVDRRSPTTARSIVNRVWQAYFGTGLVATPEDLGTQGEPPSHPELLDWLAVELMENNWSLKHIHRLIVTSATYQQSSVTTAELIARDPDNRLLARGARLRVDAEIVRDIALATSGLLYQKIGGPSVHPPAPEFLFQPPASFAPKSWEVDSDRNRYRRAIYTFRFRSVPYPVMQVFDSPNGEVACARRVRSNTPLQALATLNEPLFVECARELAVVVLSKGGDSDVDRIAYAFRRCLARDPDRDEIEAMKTFLDNQRERFSRTEASLLPLVGDGQTRHDLKSRLPGHIPPVEWAVWTAAARVLMNLDEAITKE